MTINVGDAVGASYAIDSAFPPAPSSGVCTDQIGAMTGYILAANNAIILTVPADSTTISVRLYAQNASATSEIYTLDI